MAWLRRRRSSRPRGERALLAALGESQATRRTATRAIDEWEREKPDLARALLLARDGRSEQS